MLPPQDSWKVSFAVKDPFLMELIASYMEITVVTESGENVLPNKGLPPVPYFLKFLLG